MFNCTKKLWMLACGEYILAFVMGIAGAAVWEWNRIYLHMAFAALVAAIVSMFFMGLVEQEEPFEEWQEEEALAAGDTWELESLIEKLKGDA